MTKVTAMLMTVTVMVMVVLMMKTKVMMMMVVTRMMDIMVSGPALPCDDDPKETPHDGRQCSSFRKLVSQLMMVPAALVLPGVGLTLTGCMLLPFREQSARTRLCSFARPEPPSAWILRKSMLHSRLSVH